MKLFKGWRISKPAPDNELVYISEKFGVRTLHIGSDTVQSAMRIARPNDLEVSYTRSMMAFLLFGPDPRQVLLIGLGAGSLAKFIYHRLPQARIVAVEINPRVVAVARQYFCLPDDETRLALVVGDGSEYVAGGDRRADVIMVDGYDAESQAVELATRRFYQDCTRTLNPGGMLVVNLWGRDRNFRACVDRISDAFGGRALCLRAGRPGNIVVLGFRDSPGQPQWEALRRRARQLEAAYGLEFPRFVEQLQDLNPYDAHGLLV